MAVIFQWSCKKGPKRKNYRGKRVVFISPGDEVLLYAYSLTKPCSNNIAEHNGLIIGLQITKEMGVKYVEAYVNSKLIINQAKEKCDVRNEDLV